MKSFSMRRSTTAIRAHYILPPRLLGEAIRPGESVCRPAPTATVAFPCLTPWPARTSLLLSGTVIK
jgi:hypothetical protein